MISRYQVTAEIEQIGDGGMSTRDSPRLTWRLELSHAPLCQQTFNIAVT